MKVLVTGFDPFGNHLVNPTQRMIKSLNVEYLSNKNIQFIELETSFEHSFLKLEETIKSLEPDYIFMFGLSERSDAFHLEKIAINFMDARIPDNRGFQPNSEVIESVGDDGYFSTLPLNELVELVDGKISLSAGSFVCNYVFYKTMHYIRVHQLSIKAGFIHVPGTKEMNSNFQMNQEEINQKCRQLINFAIDE